ncbi:hypothetical protein [Tellurirhabdus rosea]|uniref:hypothetical protein n=1 Tax=Tellurirhabdus rosea TaxID=2674997 RepID=UPI002252EF78|nr:hypothetical protein [Tellurirhabdus rosea]
MLPPDFYQIQHPGAHGLPKGTLYVQDQGDSIRFFVPGTDRQYLLDASRTTPLLFFRTQVDVDVFTIPFKVRPALGGVPPQLNSNFNAALYLGRRTDIYSYRTKTIAAGLETRQLRSRGLGYGLFGGIGSSTINELVTGGRVPFEYEGIILDIGVAAIYDARIFNVGLAAGADNLMDSNRRYWIYHRRPWFGVLFGLNLN